MSEKPFSPLSRRQAIRAGVAAAVAIVGCAPSEQQLNPPTPESQTPSYGCWAEAYEQIGRQAIPETLPGIVGPKR